MRQGATRDSVSPEGDVSTNERPTTSRGGALAAQFVTEAVTLADPPHIHLAICGDAPDLANFRRKVLSSDGFLDEVDGRSASGGRPAQLDRRGSATEVRPPLTRA
jgi:8-oxo-dGTP diphosphatase